MSQINQITTVRLPDGTEVAFVDWSDTPLYSTADLLAGFTDAEIDLFQYVPGEPVPVTQNFTTGRTSTVRDTNVATPGSMASTEELLVYAIRPEVIEGTVAEGSAAEISFSLPNQPRPSGKRLAILQAFLTMRLEVSQKIQHRAPFGYYNTGFGSFSPSVYGGAVAVAGVPGLSAATQGFPGQEAVRSLVIPVHIGGQEKYRVVLENQQEAAVPSGLSEANPAADVTTIVHQVRVILDGLYKRPTA